MIILTTILQMVAYWLGLGIVVAATMLLFYGIAYILGELAEWLRQRFAKPSFRNGRIGSNPILSAKTEETNVKIKC